MFIDEAEITVIAGRGGDGKVAFYPNKSGVSGGNGGKGGDVYATATSNISQLVSFLERSEYKGENGGPGGENKRNGLNGKDLFLKMPIGTTIIDIATQKEITLNKEGFQVLLCRGGKGGFGNAKFKSPTNQTPRNAQPGREGQLRKFKLILKLIADFGFIGLPNAGKSSLLNVLTAANVKTANYPFTTLEPNLGAFGNKILADVPGLIEGASLGKGLGIKFLKHIEKVNLIFHCISVESEDIIADYKTVIKELSGYNVKLIDKKSIILLTKVDLSDQTEVLKKVKQLKKFGQDVLAISIFDEKSLHILKKIISP